MTGNHSPGLIWREYLYGGVVAVCLGVIGVPAGAHAQVGDGEGDANRAASEALFNEGQRLLDAGNLAEACPKLAASQRLIPTSERLLVVADCFVKNGKTASAWAEFRAAGAMARSEGLADREGIANERAAALEPDLATLIVEVPADLRAVPMIVRRDGAPIERAKWGTAIAVDPGAYTIEALAPGKKPWSTRVEVAAKATGVTVTVPALEDEAPRLGHQSMDYQAPPIPPRDTTGRGQRIAGVVVAGLGFGVLAAGAGLGAQAIANHDESNRQGHCDERNFCDPTGLTLREDARSAGTGSTALIIVGAAGLTAGVVLYLTAPTARAPRAVHFDFTVHGGAAGIAAGGAW